MVFLALPVTGRGGILEAVWEASGRRPGGVLEMSKRWSGDVVLKAVWEAVWEGVWGGRGRGARQVVW